MRTSLSTSLFLPAVLLAALLGSGCMKQWRHSEYSPELYARDRGECLGQQIEERRGAKSERHEVMDWDGDKGHYERHDYRGRRYTNWKYCMMARGWSRHTVGKGSQPAAGTSRSHPTARATGPRARQRRSSRPLSETVRESAAAPRIVGMPHISEVSATGQLAIDGLWRNSSGVVFRIEGGRMYVHSGFDPAVLEHGAVALMDLRKRSNSSYRGREYVFDTISGKRIGWATASIQVDSPGSLQVVTAPIEGTIWGGHSYSLERVALDHAIKADGGPGTRR